jgi:two-component system chemotaxis response regulator CheB
MRAFVIDDSKPVRSILAKMLQTMDFETTEAENGQQALEHLDDHNIPDVFVVNWNMPILNGLQFIKTVKANQQYSHIPLLVVSAETKDSTKAEASNAGASGFLSKPVTLATLRTTLVSLGVYPGPSGSAVTPPRLNPKASQKQLPSQTNTSTKTVSTVAAESVSSTDSARQKIRVLIVDDSVVVRGIVSKMLQEDGDLEVVNTAADGVIALAKLEQCDVDVILLDIEMPRMTGLEVLKRLRDLRNRTPVVMFSSLTQRGASATIDALMLGAKDYVMKPGGAFMTDANEGKRAIMEELIPKVKQAAAKTSLRSAAKNKSPTMLPARSTKPLQKIDAVVIGVSTGGPQALAKLIPKFGSDFPVPVIIVQHMPAAFTKHLSDRLTTDCGFPVSEAVHGQQLEAATFVVAPGGLHLGVKRFASKVRVALNDGPAVNACKPSADVLFESAATAYSGHVLGVVLTGMGSDGTVGSKAIKQAGGSIIVQDEESSVVWGMPSSVVREGSADKVVPIDELASEILTRAWKSRKRPNKMESGNGEAMSP